MNWNYYLSQRSALDWNLNMLIEFSGLVLLHKLDRKKPVSVPVEFSRIQIVEMKSLLFLGMFHENRENIAG
jgi:hypothetical protein